MKMNMETICEQLNSYTTELEDLYWRNWVGLEDNIDISGVYGKYKSLLSLDSVDTARKALTEADSVEEQHRFRALLGQITLSFMEFVSGETQQEILRKEAQTTVRWNGKTIPVRYFRVKIFNEPDRDERRQMMELRSESEDRFINPLRNELVERMKQAVTDMGYANYIELCKETQDRDFNSFAVDMQSFLETTESLYRQNLDYYLKLFSGVGLSEKAHSSDIAAIMRCSRFDADFPPERLMPVLEKTIRGMGFSFDKIHLDLENRPQKKTRPCVSAVKPPDDVRLTLSPVGGFEDYSGFLHETGHALHFTNERRDLDFIFKFWGDRGFTEGVAYLFQNIAMNEDWLREMTDMKKPEDLIRYCAFMAILRFRRLVGSFLYQMELFTCNDLSTMRDRYKFHFERAHQVEFDTGDYLTFDMELYSAGYIRARMFEIQLRESMAHKFGSDWWRQKDAGLYLKTLFVDGRKKRADDIVRQLGYSGLSHSFYQGRYERFLKNKPEKLF
jgi:hypothetical protein